LAISLHARLHLAVGLRVHLAIQFDFSEIDARFFHRNVRLNLFSRRYRLKSRNTVRKSLVRAVIGNSRQFILNAGKPTSVKAVLGRTNGNSAKIVNGV
jgi:hypothetical protein